MKVYRENNELVIRLPDNIMGIQEVKKLIDYLRFKSILSKSKGTQKDVDEIANEIDKSWWSKNKSKFIK
jgi:hypothetical protein